tara:strand:+ start:144 stop:797 length:654 start_codon:yes stop_codon:yes gene_type:complete
MKDFPLILAMSIQSTVQSVILEVPIISYEPIIQTESKLVPKKVCKEVNQPTHSVLPNNVTPIYQKNNLGGMILGGIVGSMVGQTESQRRIGGVVGAIVGNGIANSRNNQQHYNQHPSVQHVTHCYSSWSNEVVDVVKGYTVVYELNGQRYSTTTNHKPTSNFIKINKKIVVDGVIDNSHNQIYTPTEIVPQLRNDGVEIIEDDDIEEEFISPYQNSG